MKESTLHSLITAKAIFENASSLCASGISHSTTAGLILLQDALELVFLAVLIERNIDDAAKLEKCSFDQIIGELRSSGVTVPKSGTLKALNRNRVLAKHYGQLVLPETVRGYLETAQVAMDAVLKQTVGKTLGEVFLTDLLAEGESKDFLRRALDHSVLGEHLEALTEIRKALFVEIEFEYSIHDWTNGESLLAYFSGVGSKAPFHTKNPGWISKNVREPTEYVQLNVAQLRSDALEWGVNTNELINLRYLTPAVFRSVKGSAWCVSYNLGFPANNANEQNVRYCLDRAIYTLVRKQTHAKLLRRPDRSKPFSPPTVYVGNVVYASARTDAPVVHTISSDFLYTVSSRVSGFDGMTHFYGVSGHPHGEPAWSDNAISGYLPVGQTPITNGDGNS